MDGEECVFYIEHAKLAGVNVGWVLFFCGGVYPWWVPTDERIGFNMRVPQELVNV